MVGYKLKNTVTEHGSVNRGICQINDDRELIRIQEVKGISLNMDGTASYSRNGECKHIDLNSSVSMNCWGFTPDIFPHLITEFDKFLKNLNDPLKDESYLTDVIDTIIKNHKCVVKVYDTDGSWLGVTYPEDKPTVVEGIKKLIDNGIYPKHLWI